MTSLAAQFVHYTQELTERDTWEDTVSGWGIDSGTEEPTVVLAEIADTTRWAIIKRQVFKFPDGSHADVYWQSPATEQQEQDPTCAWREVEAMPVTTMTYVPITPGTSDR